MKGVINVEYCNPDPSLGLGEIRRDGSGPEMKLKPDRNR
jgi:hypothetical protein